MQKAVLSVEYEKAEKLSIIAGLFFNSIYPRTGKPEETSGMLSMAGKLVSAQPLESDRTRLCPIRS